MKFTTGLSYLVLLHSALYSSLSYAAGSQCLEVNCDCLSIAQGKWQDLCLTREQTIHKECTSNQGKPKSYCGLHGPSAFPVATSVKFKNRPPALTTKKLDPLIKRIDIQIWSLQDDIKAIAELEQAGSSAASLQVFSLFRERSEALFSQQQQVLLSSIENDRRNTSTEIAQSFATSTIELADQLLTYSQTLWGKRQTSKNKSLYLSLSAKVAREAAVAYERSAEFYALTQEFTNSANNWQKASNVSKTLIQWEKSTENKTDHIDFYRDQTTARLNRAIFYWLKAEEPQTASTLITETDLSSAEILVLKNAEKVEKEREAMELADKKLLLERLKSDGGQNAANENADALAKRKIILERLKSDGGQTSTETKDDKKDEGTSAKDRLKALRGW